MRISILKSDPDYHKLAHKCTPYLNGKKLRYCVTADEEAGEVVCRKHDTNGKAVLNKDKTEILTEIKNGVVKIEVDKKYRSFFEVK